MTALCSGKICTIFPEKGALNLWKACTIALEYSLTQETVADRIGITPQHVSNIETGNTSVSLTTLVAIANTLTVSVDTLLCDTVLTSKVVFEREASEIFEDCNEYEVRVLVDVLKATKQSLRTVKMFEDKLNENR